MGNFKKIILICFLLLHGSLFSVNALELIYPEDGTFVVRSDYLIVKSGNNPPLEGVTIKINGLKSGIIDISSAEYKKFFRDFLILEPELSAGVNIITVEGYVAGKVVKKASAEIYYQKDLFELPPDGYRPFVMHTSQKEALCSQCHNMSPSGKHLQRSSAQDNPCGSCHKKMLDEKYVHGPAGVFRCMECHDIDSRPSKYKTLSESESCVKCHVAKLKEFSSRQFIHGPVAVGACLLCHESHSSNYPAQLRGPVNSICLACHEGLDVAVHFTTGIRDGHPVEGFPDPARSGRQLSCVSCHNPHGGVTNTFFLKKMSPMMLCQKCHRK